MSVVGLPPTIRKELPYSLHIADSRAISHNNYLMAALLPAFKGMAAAGVAACTAVTFMYVP